MNFFSLLGATSSKTIHFVTFILSYSDSFEYPSLWRKVYESIVKKFSLFYQEVFIIKETINKYRLIITC